VSETELPEATLPQATDRLVKAVDRLVGQVAHWQPGRWSTVGTVGAGSASGVDGTRADRVYALVQRLADRGADVEGRPHRPVPRLGDLVLPDQLRVITDDLVAEGAPQDALSAAAGEVDAVRRTL
jgi:hypothetical protein